MRHSLESDERHVSPSEIMPRPDIAIDVVRDGRQQRISCETVELDGTGTTRVVGWAGLMLQTAPEAVLAQRSVPPAGVYASYRFFGSPASRYDLAPTSHVVEVDSTPTPTLEAFLRQRRDSLELGQHLDEGLLA